MLVDQFSAQSDPAYRLNRYRSDGSYIVGPLCGESIAECEDVIRFHGTPTTKDIALLKAKGLSGPRGRYREYVGPRYRREES